MEKIVPMFSLMVKLRFAELNKLIMKESLIGKNQVLVIYTPFELKNIQTLQL